MQANRLRSIVLVVLASAAAGAAQTAAPAAGPEGTTYEALITPGANYDKAEFRLWLPAGAGTVRAVVVLVPGSNGDGRPMADDPVWRDFAARRGLALMACRFTDKPHDQNFIEEYAAVSRGSGQALLDALAGLGDRAGHPELGGAPLLLWGMSAGGQFNYEFTAWKPERVAAFVVNKGGIYYTALVSKAAREVPALLFTGEKDLAFRSDTIAGLFAVNRRAGALWAIVQEPGIAHAVGRSVEMSLIFFDETLPLRIAATGSDASSPAGLRPLSEKSGFIGDPVSKTIQAMEKSGVPNRPTAWLPTGRAARAWLAVVTGNPFDR
jgi:poly(3-hydroxybutyrate) depolymerase